MGGKKPLRRPLWPPTRATASNYYPLGLGGAGGAAKPLLRAPKKPAPLHGRLPAFSGAVDAFERARKCFLEWRYFFSIILSEFLKNRVALQPVTKMYFINFLPPLSKKNETAAIKQNSTSKRTLSRASFLTFTRRRAARRTSDTANTWTRSALPACRRSYAHRSCAFRPRRGSSAGAFRARRRRRRSQALS